MVWIAVIRGNGDRHAEPIIDQLLTSESVALNRGRNELDKNGFRFSINTLVCVGRAGFSPGQLIAVSDAQFNEVWVGKVTSVEYVMDGDVPTATLSVYRPFGYEETP